MIILGKPRPDPATVFRCLQDEVWVGSLRSRPELTAGRQVPNTCPFHIFALNALASRSLFDTILVGLMRG